MTYLTINANAETRDQLQGFKTIIASYGIDIKDEWENEEAGTLELTTLARTLDDIRAVNAAAYDCFGDAIIEFRSDYISSRDSAERSLSSSPDRRGADA